VHELAREDGALTGVVIDAEAVHLNGWQAAAEAEGGTALHAGRARGDGQSRAS
jgi:hypothetical protein